MNLRKKNRMPDDPGGSGSMNDLSFLLIIFFIVIASFTVNKGFVLNLPDKSKPKIVMTDELVRCFLRADGSLLFNDQEITIDELENSIKAKQVHYPNMTFMLEIDSETPFQLVVDVIDQVRNMEVENFSFKMGSEGAN